MAEHSVPTRQKEDELFETSTPLPGLGSITSPVKLVAGYDSINILGVSDKAFNVEVLEGCLQTGPFALTQTVASALSAGLQVLARRIQTNASYAKFIVNETSGSPEGSLSVCIEGLPVP